MSNLHPAWACHNCNRLDGAILLTACGCPYHEQCLPKRCLLHNQPTDTAVKASVPKQKMLTRREILREVQAASLKGLRVEDLLLRSRWNDLVHLNEKGLVLFSPHQTAVFDSRSVCPAKSK